MYKLFNSVFFYVGAEKVAYHADMSHVIKNSVTFWEYIENVLGTFFGCAIRFWESFPPEC